MTEKRMRYLLVQVECDWDEEQEEVTVADEQVIEAVITFMEAQGHKCVPVHTGMTVEEAVEEYLS
jgi:hypothetical protein